MLKLKCLENCLRKFKRNKRGNVGVGSTVLAYKIWFNALFRSLSVAKFLKQKATVSLTSSYFFWLQFVILIPSEKKKFVCQWENNVSHGPPKCRIFAYGSNLSCFTIQSSRLADKKIQLKGKVNKFLFCIYMWSGKKLSDLLWDFRGFPFFFVTRFGNLSQTEEVTIVV